MSSLTKRSKRGTDQQLVRRLAQSSLDTDVQLRSVAAMQLDTKETLHAAVAQQQQFQSSAISRFVQMDSKVDDVKSNLETVDSKVDDVARNVKEMQQDQEDARQKEKKKSAKDRQFLAPLASLVNTKTGFFGWQPVRYTNEMNKTYKVVVLSMPILVWYHLKGRPDAQIPEVTTRAYYGGEEAFPLHAEVPYNDFGAILQRTVFKPR